MAIFNSYVKQPDGIPSGNLTLHHGQWPMEGRFLSSSGDCLVQKTGKEATLFLLTNAFFSWLPSGKLT